VLRSIARQLTFANVAAALALVVALSGTAYAAGLGKNTVGSKQIKNNAVSTKDLKNGSATGEDLQGDSVGGAQVLESSLGRVPDSAALGGLPADRYQGAAVTAQGAFTNRLELAVPGFGQFFLECTQESVSFTDDEVRFGWSLSGGVPSRGTIEVAYAPANAADGQTHVHVTAQASAVLAASADRTYVDALFHPNDGSRLVRVTGAGFDDVATSGCTGVLSAQVLK
jgi:hypothetical protein